MLVIPIKSFFECTSLICKNNIFLSDRIILVTMPI